MAWGKEAHASASRRINAKSLDVRRASPRVWKTTESFRKSPLRSPSPIISLALPRLPLSRGCTCHTYMLLITSRDSDSTTSWAACAKGLTTLSRKECFLTSKCSSELPTAHAEKAELQLRSFCSKLDLKVHLPLPLQEQTLRVKNIHVIYTETHFTSKKTGRHQRL